MVKEFKIHGKTFKMPKDVLSERYTTHYGALPVFRQKNDVSDRGDYENEKSLQKTISTQYWDPKTYSICDEHDCPIKEEAPNAPKCIVIAERDTPSSASSESSGSSSASQYEECAYEVLENGCLMIRSGTEEITHNQFAGCALESVLIPASVKRIGAGAFEGCAGLRSVRFAPNSALRSIGPRAFAGTQIREFFCPAGVEEIGELAFLECKQLSSV